LSRLYDSAGAHPISTTALCLARTGSKPSERRSVRAHTAAQITVMSEQEAGAINTAPAQRTKRLSIQIIS